jgi:peptidyl-prolyl cis-trans isomerase D
MMEALRRGSSGWLAKGLLSILILSFVVFFGAGDNIRRNQNQDVATVGTTPVTLDRFNQAFRSEIDRFSQQMRRQVSVDDARKLGIDRVALGRLAGEIALDNQAQDLGLRISEQSIVDEIRAEPSFKNADGSFNRRAFEEQLRLRGLSEKAFLDRVRADEARNLQTTTLTAGIKAPRAYVDILHAYLEEQRILESVTFDPEKLIKLTPPDADKVKAHYEANKAQYMTPERRKASVLILSRVAVAKNIQVTDAEIAQRYEQDKTSAHSSVERRRVQQLPMVDEAKAKAAVDEIKKAKSFEDALKALSLKPTDGDLGLVTKDEILDPVIRDAAFSMAANDVRVVKGQFGTFVVRVAEVQAARTKLLTEVRQSIRDAIANERVNKEMEALQLRIDDLRAGGTPLPDIGKQLNIFGAAFDAIERDGKGPDGKPAFEHPDLERIALQISTTGVNLITDPIELIKDRGLAWVDVAAITAPQQKPFEAVEAEVKAALIAQDTRRETAAVVARTVDRLKKGELTLEAFAREVGSKIERTPQPITRAASPDDLGRNAVQQGFAIGKGEFAAATAAKGNGRTIVRVVEIIKAPEAKQPQIDRLENSLIQAFSNDVLNSYVAALEGKYPVKVNEAAFKGASGQVEN